MSKKYTLFTFKGICMNFLLELRFFILSHPLTEKQPPKVVQIHMTHPVITYINLIRLLTWGATNRDMSLFKKSRLWGCYKTRHVTKRDVLVLATLRYLKKK